MDEKDVIEEDDTGTLFYYDESNGVRKMPEEEFGPKDMETAKPDVWSIQGIWNSLEDVEQRAPKKRDYISFGDIGKKDYWSRYMKMNAIPETNPFEPRIMRIFQAGNEFHDLVKTIFKKSGIFINSQDDLDEDGKEQWSVIPATDTTLKQFGAYDALVGGKPNVERALSWIDKSDLSDFMKSKAQKIALSLKEKFPNGLKPMLYEIKSINSQAFWSKKGYLHEAYPHHKHQALGYLRANHNNPKMIEMVNRIGGLNIDSIDEARLLYISKDDLVVAEFPVSLNDQKLKESYDEDIRTMSYYVLNNIEPPKPDYIVFDSKKRFTFQDKKIKYKVQGCYRHNWEVERSSYFNLMTGFENPKEWKSSLRDELSGKNKKIKERVIQKIAKNVKN